MDSRSCSNRSVLAAGASFSNSSTPTPSRNCSAGSFYILTTRSSEYGTYSDADVLLNSKHELDMRQQPLDLRQHAWSRNGERLAQASFEVVVRECLGFEGVRLEKWISMSEWDERHLSDEQVLQACVDAYASFEIGKMLKAWKIENEMM
ncbi:hypothetical protein L1049_016461 [Liquidambar formosana]|uniref:3'-5' exonuclease domain-containing protein n=1 Tax=Liquidambar formosana TaxID=63359 RepID=A0AAP0S583_LIQFO